jgi:hypothetical protein
MAVFLGFPMGRVMTPDTAALRDHLVELRRDALAQLAASLPVIDCGLLRLVADAGAVLAAIEAEAMAGKADA